MSSTKQDKREGVQPLDADDDNLADSMSDEELSGAKILRLSPGMARRI